MIEMAACGPGGMRRMLTGTAAAVLLLIVAIAATWFAYAPGLAGGFVFDDFGNLPAIGATGPVSTLVNFRTLHHIRHGRSYRSPIGHAQFPARRTRLARRTLPVQAHQRHPSYWQRRNTRLAAHATRSSPRWRAHVHPNRCGGLAYGKHLAPSSSAGVDDTLCRSARGNARRHLRACRPSWMAYWAAKVPSRPRRGGSRLADRKPLGYGSGCRARQRQMAVSCLFWRWQLRPHGCVQRTASPRSSVFIKPTRGRSLG